MIDLMVQLFGLGLLFVGLGVGYARWIKPHEASLNWQGKGLLLLVVLTLMGGFIGSPVWWLDDPRGFSWDLPPLASRMLASAGWSFVAVCFFALERPTFSRLRLVLVMLFVYLAPLAVAIVLFHLDRFNPAAPITYAFFIIVIFMVTASLGYLLQQPIIIPDEPRDQAASSQWVSYWLITVAVICGLWGLALFATDQGPSTLIWVWRGDLLSSRLIATMLFTITAGAITSYRRADVARLMLITILIYGIGLTVASLWNLTVGKPIPLFYLGVFGSIALISAILLKRNG